LSVALRFSYVIAMHRRTANSMPNKHRAAKTDSLFSSK
jgi:hypothetical protein